MQNRYVDGDAAHFLADNPFIDPTLALRTYTARLLGADPSLVLHGGGNTSAKGTATTLFGDHVDVVYVKRSGADLATIALAGHPAVRLAPLERLRSLASLSDEQMVNELRLALLDATAPTPSVETLLHAYLPARFIDHTHADAVLALVNQPDAATVCRELYNQACIFIPYMMPGFELARRAAKAYEAAVLKLEAPTLMILEKHGIFTWGDTAKESYERMICAVDAAARFIGDRRRTVSFAPPKVVSGAETTVFPRLRGIVAKLSGMPLERGPFVSCRASESVLAFLERHDVKQLVAAGCATPDHVLRTKPTALFVADPDYSDIDALSVRLEDEISNYAKAYDKYFTEMCALRGVTRTKLDPLPRVVLLPGVGLCALGATLRDADAAADIYEHTINVMVDAVDVGVYAPVSRADIFDIEYWSLEQAKIKKDDFKPLAGMVALVTGGGSPSGIGRATAVRFLEEGAHVMVSDVNAKGLAATKRALVKLYGSRVEVFAANICDPQSVSDLVAATVRAFGGLDVVVSNAGSASEGTLTSVEGTSALRASLDVNLLAHVELARAAVSVMTAQARGGALLFNASKSAFNPGPGFGPYAVAKGALVALMRQYAVDLGAAGIRANAVNADRIRTGLFEPGVIESHANAKGLSPEEYFRANLLGREVMADDVARAFVYLATAHATTGCIVTVDGGNAAAFPR
jgi:rhamnose utilization protein RhaD (predicted bifunctional aldolase and dehydrogenase)/NAD(P)-dependent dehydrogenase (short-subunit alcohol dehydrogenase family)